MNKKKILIALALIALLVFFFYNGFGLSKTHDRSGTAVLLKREIRERIKKECKTNDPEECSQYGMKLTCELLRFTEKNDIANGKANCVGYARLCTEICNYALKYNRIECKCKSVVGYVTFYGINLCEILQAIVPQNYKNFVKDHDFVQLDLGYKYKYFDPSLYDYFIDCTTYHKRD